MRFHDLRPEWHARRRCVFCLVLLFVFSQDARGREFAFLVAVGDYKPSGVKDDRDLANTVPEVEELQAILQKQKGQNGAPYYEQIMAITDNTPLKPTRDNIIQGALKELRTALLKDNLSGAKEDRLLIVLNGHGVELKDEKYEFTFCPQDAKADERQSRISLKEFIDPLKRSDGKAIPREVLFIVNACRDERVTAQNFGSDEGGAKNMEVSLPVEHYAVVYACGKNQKSLIDIRTAKGPRSFFMTALLAAWQGAADKTDDGQVDLSELEDYLMRTVAKQVKDIESKLQEPSVWARDLYKPSWIVNPSIYDSIRNEKTYVNKLPPNFFSERWWEECTFININFSGMELRKKEFAGARFIGCKFRGTRMTGLTNLAGASFVDCELDGLDLSEARHTKRIERVGANTGTPIWGRSLQPGFDLTTGLERK